MKNYYAVLSLTALITGLAVNAHARSEARVAASEEGVAAAGYSKEHKVSLAEAAKRLRIQDEFGQTAANLREEFSERLAGIYLQHEPDYRIIVRLVGKNAVEERMLVFPSGPIRISFRPGASATKYELLAAVKRKREILKKMLPDMQSISVDERTGQIVIQIFSNATDKPAYLEQTNAIQTILGYPTRVKIEDAREVDLGKVRGGANWYRASHFCTAGFTVSVINQGPGVITAAHCTSGVATYWNWQSSSSPSYVQATLEAPLPQYKFYDGERDFQVHALAPGSGHEFGTGFYGVSPTTYTGILSIRKRLNTILGETVCLRGAVTGYSCGTVDSLDSSAGDCGGVACKSDWVRFSGPDLNCDRGDSGAPVFRYRVAFGLVKGATIRGVEDVQCLGVTYMSLDYVTDIGIVVL